ncbi:MAG: cation diffusion facilitator family transporter [Planctomycetaceae bacterium]
MSQSTLQRNTIVGFFASIGLSLTKLGAGVWGQSSALIADAVESLADTVGSILVWQALRVASLPPDQKHPYGYGKAEALASLGVGVLLVVAAIFIVVKSLHEILIPHEAPAAWTLLVLIGVVFTKEVLFRFVMQGADQFDSDAARADAWHHRSDAITSIAALIGVSVAIWGPRWFGIPGLVFADEVAAILASGVILMSAWMLIRPALDELLDAVAHEMVERVRTVASGVDGVREVEKVFVRKSGSGYHVDMHLHVDPEVTVRVAHALAGKVKAILKSEIPRLTGVLIHVEPQEPQQASQAEG